MLLLPRVSGVGAYKHPRAPTVSTRVVSAAPQACRDYTVRGISWFRGPFSWQSLENLRTQ